MRPDPNMKCSKDDWKTIRSLIEAGAKAKDVAKRYGISPVTINTTSCKEKWATPMRVAKAAKLAESSLSLSDPASAVAALWAERKEASRESLYQGSKKALERFFAMAPVPQSFNEAATAHKLLQNAIEPEGPPERSTNVSVQILSQQGFSPKPAIDV